MRALFESRTGALGMKTKAIWISVLLLIVCLPTQAETTAKINVGRGEVHVKSIYGAWRNIKEGERIDKGSQIQIGQEARCDLLIGNENVVRLEPGTLLEIRSLDPVRLEMPNGELFARVKKIKKGSTFEVKTPTAIATVRGTGWWQSAEKISVFEGLVQVDGAADEAIELSAGSSVEISETGGVSKPEPIAEEETIEWKDFESESQETLAQYENAEPGDSGSDSTNEWTNESVSENPSESSAPDASGTSETAIVTDVDVVTPLGEENQQETESMEAVNAPNSKDQES